jgi:chaperone required for assembly of F1-ATPase
MREMLDELFANAPLDPVEAARHSVRAQQRRRFYQNAQVVEVAGAFPILVDGRPVKTPAARPLAAPSRALAQALADEWNAQGEFIDPAKLPLTRLSNSIIDGVADAPDAVAAEVTKYLGSDLLFYRAESPEGLLARQVRIWDPVLAWARDSLRAEFIATQGVAYVPQPPAAIAAAAAAIPRDPWRLGAVNAITTLTGSALIALALLGSGLAIEAAWEAAHVDEDWNMEFWGREESAMERRARRFDEMVAAVTVLRLSVRSARGG